MHLLLCGTFLLDRARALPAASTLPVPTTEESTAADISGKFPLSLSQVNHAALFILLLAYGKTSGGHDGRRFQERCLQAGCEPGAFMTSPVMTEVKVRPARGATHQSSPAQRLVM